MRYCAILIRLLGPMVALALCLAPSAAHAAQNPAADAADAAFVAQGEDLLETSVYAIQSSGNVILATYPEDMLARFELGDIVSVSMGDIVIEVPVVGAFADVDSGMAALVVQVDKGSCRLAIYMGSFAEAHGITPETVFQIALKEKGGYADELIMRGLAYTDERSDYPGLTDEQFANFRAVTTTGMGDGVLFRSASPVNPRHNRSAYADAAMRKAGVSVALNLVDDEDDLADFEGYADSYYASVDHIARAMSVDFTSAANKAALAEELRFLAERPGTYVIHCLEGKDRSGFVVSLLECLMGASRDEVVADYMTSYANYYGVTADDDRYEAIARRSIVKTLERAFGVDDLAACDLTAEAERYLASIGLAPEEVAAVRQNLSGTAPAPEPEDDPEEDQPIEPQEEPEAAPEVPAQGGDEGSKVLPARREEPLPDTSDSESPVAPALVGGAALLAAGVALARALGLPRMRRRVL